MQTVKELYEDFVIRDQEEAMARPLDLLQGWGGPGREALRVRVGRTLVVLGKLLTGEKSGQKPGLMSSSMCGLR